MIAYCQSSVETGCDEVAVASYAFPEQKRFCRKHQEELDKIREELESKAWENNVRNKQNAIGPAGEFCATAGCGYVPLYGKEYCSGCIGGDA